MNQVGGQEISPYPKSHHASKATKQSRENASIISCSKSGRTHNQPVRRALGLLRAFDALLKRNVALGLSWMACHEHA